MSALVSIVIPCYNAAPYVEAAIESALTQTYDPIEVVLVDDGSTDSSMQIIQSYSNRVEIISTQNYGAPHARNEGIRHSSGKFIKLLDADDVLRPHIIDKQIEDTKYIESEYEIAYCNVGKMEKDGSEKSQRKRKYRTPQDNESHLEFLLRNDINTQCPLHRRKLLLKVGGFDEDFVRKQDYDLNLKLCMAGYRFRLWPGISGFLRQHDSQERITTTNHVLLNTEAVFSQWQTRYARFQKHFGGDPPAAFKRHISQRMWNAGRGLVRAGRMTEARRFFSAANQIYPLSPSRSPMLYKLFVRAVGAMRAETILQWLRDMKR